MEETWSPRARMVAAYQGVFPDRVPLAPEFWYYVPARLLGTTMIEFERDVPHWQALQHTFRHYGTEGWGAVGPAAQHGSSTHRTTERWIGSDRLEVSQALTIGGRTLTARRMMDTQEPSWSLEGFVKDFERDWPAYADWSLVPPKQLDWQPVQAALDAVGDDYLLEVFIGTPFIDFAGGPRDGGFEQVIVDLWEHEAFLTALQERYIEHVVAKIEAAFRHTSAESIFIGSGWSSLSLLSPQLWRRWEKPVLEAAVAAAHAQGGLVHHHFHGRCMGVLPELASLGLDCICPFERPPGGDVVDLVRVRAALTPDTTFNGNVHTVETLIHGTPADVEREVVEILEAFSGSPRLIVGTGDQVGRETPDENIAAMVAAVHGCGRRAADKGEPR